jgi:hypothetical protein
MKNPQFDYENKITGSYYKPDSFFDTLDKRVLVGVAVMIVLGGIVLIFG